jgi:hypothetical protein
MIPSAKNCVLSRMNFLEGIRLGNGHQIPSAKYQTSSNEKNSKSQTKRFWPFVPENWDLFVTWDLIIGI